MPPRASPRADSVTRATGLDALLVAAIEDGRDLIVPDRHRAAALRLAWARRQLAAGHAVWSTPSIHTWDAWLARQWREAAQRGAAAPAQLLDASQERVLWETVLARLADDAEDETALAQHAGAMMLAAARATQSGIDPARLALGREESLFASALQAVQRECQARGLVSLRLADAPSLGFLAQVRAPRVVGQMRLSALQGALAASCWPGEALLLAPPAGPDTGAPRLLRATDLEQELAACAAWCRRRVEDDPAARLLVLSACTEPSLPIQATMLWRMLSTGALLDERAQARWLAVEGGEPLLHQALAADALAALQIAGQHEVDTAQLQALLRSPYPGFAGDGPRLRLAAWLGELGLGRWQREDLIEALRQVAARDVAGRTARSNGTLAPAALALADWLASSAVELQPEPAVRLAATEWARRFTAVLDAAGFAHSAPLDSREQQRLARWHELLDEFAGLDAVVPAFALPAALTRLRRLAAQARHQAATADAAITLSDTLADPVAHYDGIWVLGLTENRWPAAPRPDAWVPLAAQRHADWPESGVSQRRAQALWALEGWQRCSGELVLSYPAREGDLAHRPTTLVEGVDAWPDCQQLPPLPVMGQGQTAADQQLPPVLAAAPSPPAIGGVSAGGAPTLLKGGASRLATQQACAFRAQAQWRLGAEPPAMLSSGVPPSLRGRLLHLLLQQLWEELGDQAHLLQLDESAQSGLVARCWTIAVRDTPAARWLPAQALARERARALRTVDEVLKLERTRPAFTVEQRESAAEWQGAGARVALRIDRIDRIDGEAVVLDYKSGAPVRIDLHQDSLQPLQLAVYAAALAQQGMPVRAAALLNLHPAQPAFAGVAAREGLLAEGLRPLEDWEQSLQHWQQQLLALMQEHLSGTATLTFDRRVCARCHLPALCRRAGADVGEAEDE